MKKAKEISGFLHQLSQNRTIKETPEVVRLYNNELTTKQFALLRSLAECIEDSNVFTITATTDLGEEIDLFAPYQSSYHDTKANIKINKHRCQKLVFFTLQGFSEYLIEKDALEGVDVIFLSFIDKAFKTASITFVPITIAIKEHISTNIPISTIKYVKPLNSEAQAYLIKNLSKWLTLEEDYEHCHKAWSSISAKKILCCLASELFITDGLAYLEFIGERRKKIIFDLELDFQPDLFYIINNICIWIFKEAHDIDSRHQIFNYEFTKLIPETLDLSQNLNVIEIFKNTLENSKVVYRYHLINSSKELNKTLIDLNKSLFEYISRIRQNTIDLTNTLWRDFATAFGVLLINYSLKKTELPTDYFKYFGGALCIYLILSFFLSTKINFWFYKSLKKNLKEWKPKIYGYLSDRDFNNYTLSPLKSAQNKYLFTFWIVLLLYFTMILSILHFIIKVDLSPINFFNQFK